MPGLASSPPQLPEWWPPSRRVSFRLKLSVPRVPPKMVGRRWSSRGPSEPIRASAFSAALLALQKSARPGEPVSSPVSIRIVELKPSAPRSCSTQARAAILIVCWPLLSAVPRPYMRSPSTTIFHGDRPCRHCSLLAADHVAVAVGQHGGLGGILDPPRDQERAVLGARVGQHGAVVAELFQRLGHLARDVLLQGRHGILLLAGGRNGHPPLQLGQEAAVVEILLRAPDGAISCAGHEVLS